MPTASFLQQALVTGRTDTTSSALSSRRIRNFVPHPSSISLAKFHRNSGNLRSAIRFRGRAFQPDHRSQFDSCCTRPTTTRKISRTWQPTTVHEDTWLVRIDHKLDEKTTFYGRAQRDMSLVAGPNGNLLRSSCKPSIILPIISSLSQHTFSPNFSNEAKFYVNRAPFHNPQASVLPYAVSTPNFESINNNSADIEVGTTYGMIDNLTFTHGRNTFKMGMEIRRVRLNQGQTTNNNLVFSGNDDTVIGAQLSQT